MDMFIDGGWQAAGSGATFPVTDPRSGSLVDSVPAGGAAEAELARTRVDLMLHVL